ncbi:MAG: PEGA domain-containing protein [Myxococcales bacterium]|nr:PEGA domain-containing protein [Myxococcales bacterium]
MKGLATLLVLAIAIGAPVAARADAADDLINQAITEYGLGRFEASKALLKKALAASSRAAQKARAELYLGVNAAAQNNRKAAIAHFERALGHDAALEVNASAVKPRVMALFRRVRARVTGRLSVSLAQPPAVVVVDGREIGPAPQILRLKAGKHSLTLRLASGKVLYARTINVAAARTLRVEARPVERTPRGTLEIAVSRSDAHVLVDGKPVDSRKLELTVGEHHVTAWAPGFEQATRTVRVSAGSTARVELALSRDASASSKAPASGGRRIFTWVAAGAAVIALGVGTGFAIASNGDYAAYQDNCSESRAGDVRCVDLMRRIDNRDLAANVLIGVGAGLAAAGVALWFIEGAMLRKERRRGLSNSTARTRFTPLVGQVNGGSLRVSF